MDKTRLNNQDDKVEFFGSISLIKFIDSLHKDMDYFYFIIETMVNADYGQYLAKTALDNEEVKYESPDELLSTQPGKKVKRLRKYRQEHLEMFLNRLIDNFQNYLVELITEVLHSKPNILFSKQPTVSIEQILNKTSIDELLQEIIEDKVNSLSYKGFNHIKSWCTDRGIPIMDINTEKLNEYIALRNIIVHNRAVIDEKFIRTVKRSDLKVGEKFKLGVDFFFKAVEVISEFAKETDKETVNKFNLKSYPLSKKN